MPGQVFLNLFFFFFDKLGFFFIQTSLNWLLYFGRRWIKWFVEILYDRSRKILNTFFVHRSEIVYNFGENILNTEQVFQPIKSEKIIGKYQRFQRALDTLYGGQFTLKNSISFSHLCFAVKKSRNISRGFQTILALS